LINLISFIKVYMPNVKKINVIPQNGKRKMIKPKLPKIKKSFFNPPDTSNLLKPDTTNLETDLMESPED